MYKNDYKYLTNRTKELGLCTPLTFDEINSVEKELNLILPNDFKQLSLNCSYEFIGGFEFYNFSKDKNHGIIAITQKLREIYGLPNEYLILSQNGASAIFMKIISSEKSEVIWCDEMDGLNLLEGKPMEYNPTIFKSFVDFYEFLLDREEEERRAEGSS